MSASGGGGAHGVTVDGPLVALRSWAAASPHDVAVVGPRTTLTSGELWDTALRLVGWWRSIGIEDSETIAFAVPDDLAPACVIALLLRGGAGASYVRGVPVGPDAVISRVVATEPVAGVPDERRIVLDERALHEMADVDVAQVTAGERAAGAPAWMIFTSGTTGVPKAIAFTEAQLWARLEASLLAYPPGTRFSTMFGLGSLGAQIGFLGSLRDRTPHIVPGPPEWRLGVLRELGITMLAGSPQQLIELHEAAQAAGERLPALERLIIGGAPPSDYLIRALAGWFGAEVWDMYGSTEAHMVAARRLDVDGEDAPAFIVPGASVEVVDENDEPLPDGEVGALRVRTPTMVTGYLDGEADAAQHGFVDGWFYPGDLAARTGPQLRVVGRADDLINFGGSKVRPERIEAAVCELAGVREAGVVVVTDRFGHPMIALAVVADGMIDPTDATERLRERFAGLAPRYIVRVAELPRTETGKLRRQALAEELQSRLAASIAGD